MHKYKKVDKMKKQYEKYKEWKLELRRKMAQRYADLIIRQLKNSKTEFEFNYWMNQGVMLDSKMVGLYDIYLD
jgi:hypothetical protein